MPKRAIPKRETRREPNVKMCDCGCIAVPHPAGVWPECKEYVGTGLCTICGMYARAYETAYCRHCLKLYEGELSKV